MTLEEAIAHHEWAAGNCEGETSEEHAQMAAWLEELVELRKSAKRHTAKIWEQEQTIEYQRKENVDWEEQYRSIAVENAKLRELVRDYDKCLDTALYLAGNAGYTCMPDSGLFSSLHPRMRELAIEVDE